LRAAEAGGVESMVHVPWPIPFPSFQHRVALTFGLHLDMVERGRVHDEIRFHWTSGSRLLPDFAGTVRFRIEGRGTRIAIEGGYAAPLGIAGRIIDLVLGRRIARASVTDLARRLDTYVGARQNAWSVLHPAMLV
jgi:hypothetical protein